MWWSEQCREEVWRREVWKRSRLLAYQCIESVITSIQKFGSDDKSIRQSLQADALTRTVTMKGGLDAVHIVLVDDTFHLRSMRRTLVRIAQQCIPFVSFSHVVQTGYASAFIQCPFELAVNRNSLRSDKYLIVHTATV